MLLSFHSVSKRYGSLMALSNINLDIEGGRIGLLGPNGAGKSTFLKIVLGLVQHDEGVVKVLDHDVAREPEAVRALVGYMPEGDSVLTELTALQYTTLAAELCGLPRAEAIARSHQVLHYVGLGEARYRKLGSYSTGMKQRARLAQAIVSGPKLILLDEPTSGLDPRGRDEMLNLIWDIPQRTGASVILSTHILPDVEKICDKVLVIAAGEILYAGELAPLIAPEAGVFEVRPKGEIVPLKEALERGGCLVKIDSPGSLSVRVPPEVPPQAAGRFILEKTLEAKQEIRHLAPLVQTLERAFMSTLRESGKA